MKSMTIWELFQQVGWTMVPIYLCSLFVVAVAVRKWLDFRAAALDDTAWFEETVRHIEAGDRSGAERHAREAQHPAGRVISGLLRAAEENPEAVDAETQRLGLEQAASLEKNLRPLSLTAEIAPLLGLLGTVVGMVELFMGIEMQSSGAMGMATLSGGIWKALLTTAAGLTVAVPALAVHAWFSSLVDRFKLQMTSMVQRMRYAIGVEGRVVDKAQK